MQYLVLIHNSPAVTAHFAAMSDAERAAAYRIYWDVESELGETGELLDSKALDTDEQKAVRRGEDGPVLSPTVSGEHAAVVSGYYLVDVTNEARAAEIAARFPEADVDGGMRIVRVWTEADFPSAT